ncbi:ABC transporter substrate-binding protein [Comamonas sp. Y33R10-2]|uniref:ABC transporter substrate-binding protein n=1 Tax=Comamonas sp. Y33R10-2 TaxID=2853257 RepID=UPI001C5C9DD5|nr:ABC transporter substrate-binding protein [Comamonas sp. Y33R10-2]QXZ09128.1 ABC transporter substrate-binding protein [Comamonas sp. Y33R10-2]
MPKPVTTLNRRQLLACGLATAGAGMGISSAAMRPVGVESRLQATAGKRFRVLMLTYRGTTDVDIGFQNHLKEAGLNVEFTVRDVQQDASRIAAILDELPTIAPDLIYTWGTPVTLAVTGTVEQPNPHPGLRNIPVVFALVADPQKAGIVNALNAPERNVTGAIHVVPLERQLQHMRSYREFDKLGVIYNAAEANSLAVIEGLQQYGQANGKQILVSPLQQSADGKPTAQGLESLIEQLHSDGAQWLYLPPDTFLGTLYERLTPLAMARKLPLFASTELAMRSGNALTGVVSRYYSVGQLAAAKAADILQGKKTVQQTPVESLKRFSLMVNMQMAQQLELYPPLPLLNYAEVVATQSGASTS